MSSEDSSAGGAGDQSNCNSVHGLTVRYYTGTGLGSGTSLDNKEMQTTPAICYIYTWWTQKNIRHFKQNIFSNPHFNSRIDHCEEFISGIGNAMPELPSKSGRNWSQFWKSIPLLIKSGIDFRKCE